MMRKLVWLKLLVNGYSSTAKKNVTLTPIILRNIGVHPSKLNEFNQLILDVKKVK